ncbi:MAG TPA: biotin--[acetyl-CoA-carboxylase] ligase, partial [Gemmatimonadaceae bacterium]
MASYDDVPDDELTRRLKVPRVVALDEVGSTLDVAHSLAAEGALAGTVIVADSQSAGRGRMGRGWRSAPGAGVWLTMIERPAAGPALDVLSLRVGIELAPALDPFAAKPVRLKWPNDLYVGDRKLGGVLVEARWRDGVPEWVAIGVGVNVVTPEEEPRAIGLAPGASRLDVLGAMVPAIRAAATRSGQLTASEIAAFSARDLAAGRRCELPVAGKVI